MLIYLGIMILDVIKEVVSDNIQVIYEEFLFFDILVEENFSYVIVVVGEFLYVEFIGDNSMFNIFFNVSDVISVIIDKFLIFVILVFGRLLVLESWFLENIDVLVVVFLFGSEGVGVIDVVFGDYEFEGLFFVIWFKNVN